MMSQDNSVGTEARSWAGRYISSTQHPDLSWVPFGLSNVYQEVFPGGKADYSHPVYSVEFGMCGTIPLFPHMSSWHGE